MEPFEKDELSDRELDALLPQWKAPEAPARLKAAVFPPRARPWWLAVWSASFRVPVPVACALLLGLAFAAARWTRPLPPPRVIVRTERVEVPVIQERVVTRTVYRTPKAPAPATASVAWRPVQELNPRIIRSGHAAQ